MPGRKTPDVYRLLDMIWVQDDGQCVRDETTAPSQPRQRRRKSSTWRVQDEVTMHSCPRHVRAIHVNMCVLPLVSSNVATNIVQGKIRHCRCNRRDHQDSFGIRHEYQVSSRVHCTRIMIVTFAEEVARQCLERELTRSWRHTQRIRAT